MEQRNVMTKVSITPSSWYGDDSITYYTDKYKAVFVKPIGNNRDWSLEVFRKGEGKEFSTVCVARSLEEIAFMKDAILNVLFENNLIDLYVIGNKGIEKLDNEI